MKILLFGSKGSKYLCGDYGGGASVNCVTGARCQILYGLMTAGTAVVY